MRDINTRKKLLYLFTSFFKIGCMVFGGGIAMLPFIEDEYVNKKKLISQEEITDIFAISQSLPGAIAVNVTFFIGNKIAGPFGAIFASLGIVLPAFLSIVIMLLFLQNFKDSLIVQKVFSGIKAASTALIFLFVVKLGKSSLKSKYCYAIALTSFIMIFFMDFSAVTAIAFGAIVGLARHYLRKVGENGSNH